MENPAKFNKLLIQLNPINLLGTSSFGLICDRRCSPINASHRWSFGLGLSDRNSIDFLFWSWIFLYQVQGDLFFVIGHDLLWKVRFVMVLYFCYGDTLRHLRGCYDFQTLESIMHWKSLRCSVNTLLESTVWNFHSCDSTFKKFKGFLNNQK